MKIGNPEKSDHVWRNFVNDPPLVSASVLETVSREMRDSDHWPGLAGLNKALAQGTVSGGGAPIRFAKDTTTHNALAYERQIFETGKVPTRANWHDLFNAFCWMRFPRAKATINRRHVEESTQVSGRRTRLGDALTLVDESGVLVVSTDRSVERWNRAHRWRELFVDRRSDFGASIDCFLVGHGAMEQSLNPYLGWTVKAIHATVRPDYFDLSPQERLVAADELLSQSLSTISSPASLAPWPILGTPGWWPNNDPAFYDNTDYFRPRKTG